MLLTQLPTIAGILSHSRPRYKPRLEGSRFRVVVVPASGPARTVTTTAPTPTRSGRRRTAGVHPHRDSTGGRSAHPDQVRRRPSHRSCVCARCTGTISPGRDRRTSLRANLAHATTGSRRGGDHTPMVKNPNCSKFPTWTDVRSSRAHGEMCTVASTRLCRHGGLPRLSTPDRRHGPGAPGRRAGTASAGASAGSRSHTASVERRGTRDVPPGRPDFAGLLG
jgi:hypothetical protein